MINGTKVYTDAKDLNVSGRVFYVKAADSKLYKESACTNKADGGDVFAAFLAGNLLIVNAGSICTPTAVIVDSGTVSVDILTVATNTATVVTVTAACASGDTKTAADFGKIVPAA